MPDEVTMTTKLLRYPDLRERGIFRNRATLYRWIAAGQFPRGLKIGPNTRVWTEDEVNTWLRAQIKAA